jgi:hypothetical protein
VKVPFSVIRFVLEATFIVLIAAATALAHLGWVWIALSVGGAWILVTVVERSALQGSSVLHNGLLAFLFAGGRAQAVPEDAVQEIPPHDFSSETAPAEHPPTPDPEPEPPPPEPAPPAPEPVPPTPEPGAPPPQLRSVPPPEPESEPAPEEVPEPVARLPLDAGEPREWNVWELERLAREAEGSDSSPSEELAFLLLELRQFANADGQLPVGFDPIVRESFGELLYAAV